VNAKDQSIKQLENLLAELSSLRARTRSRDLKDLPGNEVVRLVTSARAAIRRIAGPHSAYFDQCEKLVEFAPHSVSRLEQLMGVVDSLRDDLSKGYLDSIAELIHGSIFGDYLEMAQHLLDEGYKDAAAVIAGSTLEAHLRKLCDKAGVESQTQINDEVRPKKADQMNVDLAGKGVYSKLDQKNVTAWLDLRNKAAHGRYNEYSGSQVELLISGIRDFITRNPA